jgi:hypothetical protein
VSIRVSDQWLTWRIIHYYYYLLLLIENAFSTSLFIFWK